MVFLLIMILIAISIKVTSKGPIFYWSERVGKNKKNFEMPKFRTMLIDTPVIATHQLTNPEVFLTPIGGFLRRNSLDELPQLFSIFVGDMSFVGPRPALFNQKDLIDLRSKYSVEKLMPGLTGWAQVNGRDELPISDKVKLDFEYMKRQSFIFDMKILWLTFSKVIKKEGIIH